MLEFEPCIRKLSPLEINFIINSIEGSRFVAFDFETTGLSSKSDRIIEVGAISFHLYKDENKWLYALDNHFETFVNPECTIPWSSKRVHGIGDNEVKSAPKIYEVLQDFIEFIEGSILMAHNAPFDSSFLRNECQRSKIIMPHNKILDTLAMAKTCYPNIKSYTLKNLAQELKIQQSNAHRGFDDSFVCMSVFTQCANVLIENFGKELKRD